MNTVHVRMDEVPTQSGDVVQLVRTPACHVGGRGFEPRRPRQFSRAFPDLRGGEFIGFERVRSNRQCDADVGLTQALRYGRDWYDIAEKFARVRAAVLFGCEYITAPNRSAPMAISS